MLLFSLYQGICIRKPIENLIGTTKNDSWNVEWLAAIKVADNYFNDIGNFDTFILKGDDLSKNSNKGMKNRTGLRNKDKGSKSTTNIYTSNRETKSIQSAWRKSAAIVENTYA